MCGIAGIISIKQKGDEKDSFDLSFLEELFGKIEAKGFLLCREKNLDFEEHYLGGSDILDKTQRAVRALKHDSGFFRIFSDKKVEEAILRISSASSDFALKEAEILKNNMGRLSASEVEIMGNRLEKLKDITWCLNAEIQDNIRKIRDLLYRTRAPMSVVAIFKRINAVLNSIDRLEVRGRDSAGISIMFIMDQAEFESLEDTLDKANFMDQLRSRTGRETLVNGSITIRKEIDNNGAKKVSLVFCYKVAAEIGSLGDNVAFLRSQIKEDRILQAAVNFPHLYFTVLSHTRWASVGAISEPNCHPVDNITAHNDYKNTGIFHVVLNGDIDNYLELKERYESAYGVIPQNITTDTKIIPLQIESYIHKGHDLIGAFRLAVNDFKGSHAIVMHTDMAPGKLFLAQKGSGQAIFTGLSDDHYMATSEVYGFIEETSRYIKLDGEKTIEGKEGPVSGQIFILDQDSKGGLDGINAFYYDGTPIELTEDDIKYTEITSRDIDRQEFSHYFLKEISEAPVSVEKTLQNRWRITDEDKNLCKVTLDKKAVPESLAEAIKSGKIRRVFFMGQGTAGVAAQACANIMEYYMNDPDILIDSVKASELSGFKIHEKSGSMENTLVVAISQSGTTTDTNRTVDMVREKGAHTLAIVNRRDSDITFKVDGVIYTSSGRDIEMSVASTKAFYSQIVAGALLALYLVQITGKRNEEFITGEIKKLLALPDKMRKILSMKDLIEKSARRSAVARTYWAAVGSGPNKTSADEIRIKLSELCYKTISSDYVEDKKHIDLSSEPLIIVCAAGTRETVIGDIIKDTAIFNAHKALTIVIADKGETRFTPHAHDVFYVPRVSEHFAPIVNTLVGHIWGYYAALTINEGSRFLYTFRQEIQNAIDDYASKGLDVYELILEKAFREKIALFYSAFRKKRMADGLPSSMGLNTSSDLTVLLKYLSGRLPVTDFEMDFGVKGTAKNMLDTLFECLGQAINNMARPVDAIKHQAKTVTVGTSRISEKTEGLLFDILARNNFSVSQLTPSNVIVLKNIQEIVAGIQGMTLYKIENLNLLGEVTSETTINVIKREGTSKSIPSTVERDNQLKGTKYIIVRRGNIYIGRGRRDARSILCIPLISDSLSTANMIEHLILLHISFKENVPLSTKIKALGGKYDNIKNIVMENSVIWNDSYLDLIDISDLFGISAEKIAEMIISRL